jgi:hypothetical protein
MTTTSAAEAPEGLWRSLEARSSERAGEADDLTGRARRWLALYVASGRRWRFALITLHAALWLRSLLRVMRWVGWLLPRPWRRLFEDVLAINRAVFIALDARYGLCRDAPDLAATLCPDLLAALTSPRALTPAPASPDDALASPDDAPESALALRAAFAATLAWEQRHVITPLLADACARLRLTAPRSAPLLLALLRRSWLWLPYFPSRRPRIFQDFFNENERIEQSMACYDLAQRVGWAAVEARAMTSLTP